MGRALATTHRGHRPAGGTRSGHRRPVQARTPGMRAHGTRSRATGPGCAGQCPPGGHPAATVARSLSQGIGLCERAAPGAELRAQLVEEPEVDVDVLVARAVERTAGRRRDAAAGADLVGEVSSRPRRVMTARHDVPAEADRHAGKVLSDREGRASRDSAEDCPPPCGRSLPNTAAYPAPGGSPRAPGEVRGPPAVCQGPSVCARLEATIGFEPMNKGFANPRVGPLRHVAR